MMTTPRHDADQLPDNNRLALRQVARSCRKAALASMMDGAPYASLVTLAFDHDLSPIMLLSGLSDHTKNIMADSHVSLLLDGTDGHVNPQTGPRVTIMGRAEKLAADHADSARLTARFLARHPSAARYAGFADFAIWRVVATRAHFVGGFGRAVWFDAPFGLTAPGLAKVEADVLTTINTTHAAELAQLGDGWQVTAVDVDGMDVANQDVGRRLTFPTPVEGGDQAVTAAFAALHPSNP